jgi:hypothetical protein
VKSLLLGLTVFCMIVTSCATHFYKINGQEVTLFLEKSDATNVLFLSSLNHFESQELNQQNGVWEVTLPANIPFRYFYKVDGKIFLPPCPMKEKDNFGSENCIFEKKL